MEPSSLFSTRTPAPSQSADNQIPSSGSSRPIRVGGISTGSLSTFGSSRIGFCPRNMIEKYSAAA